MSNKSIDDYPKEIAQFIYDQGWFDSSGLSSVGDSIMDEIIDELQKIEMKNSQREGQK